MTWVEQGGRSNGQPPRAAADRQAPAPTIALIYPVFDRRAPGRVFLANKGQR